MSALAAATGSPVREIYRDPLAVVHLDSTPSHWRGEGGESGLAWNERVPERADAARSWTEAAGGGASGLVVDGESRTLHASASGLGAIYWLRRDDAIYFATSVDALARAGLRTVTPDWQAWASMLLLSYPIGERTPFAEIRCLPPLGRIRATPRGVESIDGWLDWAEATPPAGDPADTIAASLRAQAKALEPFGPIDCPLTGGWDSRAIACTLAELGLLRETFTVNSDRGDADDEELANVVARGLGVPHRVVESQNEEPARELEAVAGSVDYQAFLHLHIHRLVQGMPGGTVWADGIAGGLLIRGFYLNPQMIAAPDSMAAAEALIDRLTSRGKGFLRSRAWDAIRAPTRATFLAEARRFEDHAAAFALTVYWTRTRRAIGAAPARIMGSRHRLYMPFLDRDLAAAALAVPPKVKLGGDVYRAVLNRLDPRIASLPSTNDGAPRRTTHPSRTRSRAGQDARLALLRRSPLRPWFARGLKHALESHDLSDLDASARTMRRIDAICTYTLWCDEYRDLIGEPDPAELFR